METAKQAGFAPDEEALLLGRVRSGEISLFDRLVANHRRNMLLLCRSILENSADAEDAVQDALLKAFEHLDQLRSDDSFRAWLLRIALNEAREHRRKSSKWKLESIDDSNDDEEGNSMPRQFGDWRPIPSVGVEREQTREILETALNSLPEKYREILVLREVELLGMTEVASIIGISLSAATSRLHRARLEMRERVAPFFAKPTPRWVPVRMMFDMTRQMLSRTIDCKKAMRELSNYIDGQIDASLRTEIERHLQVCSRCAVVLDSTRSLLRVMGDDLVFPTPMSARQDHPGAKLLKRNRGCE